MAGENGGTDNPLSEGTNPHSVETAAADFSAMLEREDAPASPRQREKPAARSPEPKGPDATEERTERQPAPREREEPSEGQDDQDDRERNRDPILDGDAADQDNEEADDTDNDQDDQDGDDQDGDDDQDPEAELFGQKIKVTVNGQESEITVQEARDGYMRQADYTAGTERNAREYDEIQTFAAESVEHRKRAVDTIDQTLALMQSLQPSQEDWDYMEKNDPPGFIKAQKHWQGIQTRAAELFAQRQAFVEDAGKTAVRRDAKYFQDQERALVRALPALADPKKADGFRNAVMEYGLAAGYSEQELIEGAVDHRDLITLYKAAQYDKSRKAISEAGRRGNNKGPKPTGEGRAKPTKGRNNGMRNADRRLARTGSLRDAAEGFRNMILAES